MNVFINFKTALRSFRLKKVYTTLRDEFSSICLLLVFMILSLTAANAQIISQYVETDSGTTPKGIEIWNNTSSTLDFSSNNLIIQQGTNGGALADIEKTKISTGTLASGSVLVIGTLDIKTYLTTQGLSDVTFLYYGFSFNGNDALAVKYGEIVTDIFGNPGIDPGSSWSVNSVSTANQNIELNTGILLGSEGWTDPSLRFTTVSTTPSSTGGLSGFGVVSPIINTPTILSPSPASLSGFVTNAEIESDSQTFTVGGSNLTDDLLITAPTGFEVRESEIGSYSPTVSFMPESGTVSTKTIEIRISSSASAGSKIGNVVCSSTNAASQIVSISGIVNLLTPLAKAATNPGTDSFTANWETVAGASDYKLDVSTDEKSTITETFSDIDGGTISSYLNRTWIGAGSIIWNGYKIRIDQSVIEGDDAITLKNEAGAYIISSEIPGNPSSISFEVKQIFTGSGGKVILKIISGVDYSTFTEIGTYEYDTESKTIEASITGITGPYKIRIDNGNTLARPCIDNLSFNKQFLAVIDGYNDFSVSGTSQAVTGLSSNTTYYYQVHAVGGDVTSEYSNTITAITAINDLVDASTFADCSTCDIVVATGGTLNIDESKTFNSVTVAAGGKLTLKNGANLSPGTLTLESNISGTATFVDENTIPTEITANVQQYITAERNWYMSIPVTAANAETFSTASLVVSWDEENGSWTYLTSESALNPLRGYISGNVTSSGVITFNGTLNTGEETIPLTYTEGNEKAGFNLVGNPYPSYINWTSDIATAANVLSTIWYRTKPEGSSYAFYTYNATGSVGVPAGTPGVIPPMQAFWVRVNSGGGTLTLNNSMRTHGSSSNLLKAPSTITETQKILRLQVSNGINSDEAVIYFNDNASNSFDAYDSPKMSNPNAISVPEIFTLADKEELVINGLSKISINTEIPLGFHADRTNNFSIKASEIKNFDSDILVFLIDKKENKEQEINTENAYFFSSDSIITKNRFSIIFRSVKESTDLINSSIQSICISKNANNQIVINDSELNNTGSVVVFNAIGQKVVSKELTGMSTTIDSPFRSGVYVVKIIKAGKSISQKVIID